MKNRHIPEKQFNIWLITLILIVAFLYTCSRIAPLKFPSTNNYLQQDAWLTAYKSNLRHNSLDSDVQPPYQIVWDKKYRSVVTDHPLAIHNYIIMTLKNGNVAFFDIEEGRMIGDGRIAPAFEHSATIENNIMYYGANLGRETLIALDLSNFKKLWKTALPHIYTPPLIWDQKVYAGTNYGQLFCVDKLTGNKIWHFPAKASIYSTLAESEGHIFFGDAAGNLYCIDGKNGESLWTKTLAPNIYSGPVIAENRIFIGTTAGIMYALDLKTGKIIWQINTGGSIYANAAYKEGIIFLGNNAHNLLALDTNEGEILWQYQTNGIINSTPLIGNEYIYFGSWDKSLYTLIRKTGKKIYQHDFKSPIKSSPIIYRDRLYVHTANDHFYCLTTSNIDKKIGL